MELSGKSGSTGLLLEMYRDRLKGLKILLSNSQAGPGRTVKQEQEEISLNHVQTFISLSVVRQPAIVLSPHF